MLEKVKGFIKEHKAEVTTVVAGAATIGVFAFGYLLGCKQAVRYCDIGLNACFLVKPELKPMLEEALKEVEKTIPSK